MQAIIEWFPVVTVGIYLTMFVGRSLQLGLGHHVRVFVLLRTKGGVEAAREALLLVAFPLWVYLVVATAGPFSLPTLPSSVDPVLVEGRLPDLLGAVLMGSAAGIFAWSLASFGRSWRVGIDHSGSGGLITSGAFRWSRNPIFLSLDLMAVGAFLMSGRLLLLLFALGICVGLHAQILAEERFLAGCHGRVYRDYCASVGRYLGRTLTT